MYLLKSVHPQEMFAILIVVLSFFKLILAYNGTKGRELNMYLF